MLGAPNYFDDKAHSWNAIGEMIHDTNTSPLPVFFGSEKQLFGWLHFSASPISQSMVVICNPIGFEQVRTHATVRELAEVLADDGHTVLRFDYPSTGDSLDLPDTSGHVNAWIESIKTAIEYASGIANSKHTTLVGIRLGGTLANIVAEDTHVDGLVLWEPSESGKLFCREMQILASTTNSNQSAGIDAGGFVITTETQESLNAMRLGTSPLTDNPPILLLERDDIRSTERRINTLENLGSTVTQQSISGYKQMMLAPQDSVVPVSTLAFIKNWLREQTGVPAEDICAVRRISEAPTNSSSVTHFSNGISEQAIRFGPDGRLFGILTRSRTEIGYERPTLITLCGGAVPHYSANRMYVALARRLASRGVDVLRIDLSGIGDSLAAPGGPRQIPYTSTTNEDLESAMDAVTTITGAREFSLFGLCSGAFGAMQAAMKFDQINEIILVNQLVYFVSENAYEKLAAGTVKAATDLDFPRNRTLPDRVFRKALKSAGVFGAWIGSLFQDRLIGGPLNQLLMAIKKRGTYIVFIHSEADPAIDALLLPAQRTVCRLIESNSAVRIVISNTDHTFSPAASQQQLIDAVVRVFDRRDNP